MLRISLQTLRAHRTTLTGAFVAICAAIEDPQRAATMMPASTGPISRAAASPTVPPTNGVAPYFKRNSEL